MVRAASLVLGLVLLLSPTLVAQNVTIILFQPPPNQLRVADLWRVNLVNTSRTPVEIYLRGTVTEARDGLVVDAESRVFTLPPGSSQFTGSQLEPIRVNSSNDRYREILTRTGTAPTGEYTICVYAIEVATGAEIGDNCITHAVERFSPPILISPTDASPLNEKLPVFTWTPPVPTPRSRTGLSYRLRIAEILGRQTPYDALQSNPAFFERRDIRTPVLQYPPTARSFTQGRRYAWGISAYDGTVEIGESEVWSFTATDIEGVLAAELIDEKLVATLITMKGDHVVAGRGGSATLVDPPGSKGTGRFGAVGTITAGGGSTDLDAQVWTWGNNEHGQLATGAVPATARSTPKAVAELNHIRKLALGAEHGLAIEISGNVGAWGNNDFGQLGTGNDESKNQPIWIPGLTGVIDIGAGNYHSIALKNDGTVWTWGYNRSGELGRTDEPDDYAPGKVGSIVGVIAVAAGDGHSLALKSDGTVWGWGTNRYGQADPSNDAEAIVTRPVKIDGLSGVRAIAAGGTFSLALLEDGTVRSWGGNNSGQLGNGEAEPGATLVNRLLLGRKVLSRGDGGEDPGRRLRARATGRGETPGVAGKSIVKNLELGAIIVNLTGVSKVSGLTGVVAIDAGGSHALALRSDSTLWAWGNNNWGALGLGDRTNRPGPSRLNSLDRVTALAAGSDHSLATTVDRTLWAWGDNTSKQLGSSSLPASAAPDGEEFAVDPVTVPKQ